MTRLKICTSAILFVLTATTALGQTMIKEITVKTDLSAFKNEQALDVLATLDTDLAQAIATRVSERLDDDGARILIDIDEISLANSFEQGIGTENAVLVGDVQLLIPGVANNQNYTLTVSSSQAQAYFPDGTQTADFTLGNQIYYDAMLDAFADNVVRNLDQ